VELSPLSSKGGKPVSNIDRRIPQAQTSYFSVILLLTASGD
jgi:hypothetical protein